MRMRIIRICARRTNTLLPLYHYMSTNVNNYFQYYVKSDTLAGARVSGSAGRVKRFIFYFRLTTAWLTCITGV